VGTVKAVLLAALVVYACQGLGALSDHHYFGLMPTTLAVAGCFWYYRRITTKDKESRTA
jgi:hypothetical protein